jgi:SAM-dependent methyltransferase
MNWFDTKSGKNLIQYEQNIVDGLFDNIFGYHIVQTGLKKNFISNLRFRSKTNQNEDILFDECFLPFDNDSIDCFLAVHQNFENSNIFKEFYRALIPHGYCVFISFNPYSLAGLKSFFSINEKYPWNDNFESFSSFQGRLIENNFEIVNGKFFHYHPFFKTTHVSANWNKIGDRWFPLLANLYVIVARKKISTLTPIKPNWSKSKHRNTVKIL